MQYPLKIHVMTMVYEWGKFTYSIFPDTYGSDLWVVFNFYKGTYKREYNLVWFKIWTLR